MKRRAVFSKSFLLLLHFLLVSTVLSQEPRPSPTISPSPIPVPALRQKSQEEPDENEVIKVETTLITVPVSVSDRAGTPVSSLRKENFRLYQDGVEQSVAFFATLEKPFTVALLLDTSRSTRFRLEDIQAAAIAFVKQLRPDDRVTIISFDDELKVLTEPTSNRELLQQAILKTKVGQGTRLFDAVGSVLNKLLAQIQGRKAIVLFTDGADTASQTSTYESTLYQTEESDILIYPIFYGTYPGPAHFLLAESYVQELVNKSGAHLYRADELKDLQQSFALIAEQLRRQYTLGYYPKSPSEAGERHQIKVQVNDSRFIVRTRASYTSSQTGRDTGITARQFLHPQSIAPVTAKPTTNNLVGDEQLQNFTNSQFTSGEIHLRSAAFFGNDARQGSFLTVLLHVDLRDLLFKEEKNNWQSAAVDIGAVAVNVGGAAGGSYFQTYPVRERGEGLQQLLANGKVYLLRFPLQAAGELRLRFAARDANSGRLGYTSQIILIPDLSKNRLALSGIILSGNKTEIVHHPATAESQIKNVEEMADDLAVANGPVMRRFEQGANIYYRFAIYNAQINEKKDHPQLELQLRLYKDGQLIRTSTEEVKVGKQLDGKRMLYSGVLRLGREIGAGQYAMQIRVADLQANNQQSATEFVDFQVTD